MESCALAFHQNVRLLPPHFSHNVATATALYASSISDEPKDDVGTILQRCVNDRSVDSTTLIDILEELDRNPMVESDDLSPTAAPDDGLSSGSSTWELVFGSSVASLPLVGKLLGGYFPNEEIVELDFDSGTLSLEVSTLPLLPKVRIEGSNLRWISTMGDGEMDLTLSYRVSNSAEDTTWKVLYYVPGSDAMAVKSSKTGSNVLRRRS